MKKDQKFYNDGYFKALLDMFELLSAYAIKTKDIPTLDLLEEIQQEILSMVKTYDSKQTDVPTRI